MQNLPHVTRENPFSLHGKWWFTDETGAIRGPYKSHRVALLRLLEYIDRGGNVPSRWERFKALVARFIRST